MANSDLRPASFSRLRSDERGATAMLFGIVVVPLVGLTGVALDYGYAANVRTLLQARADTVALGVAKGKIPGNTAINESAALATIPADAAVQFGSGVGTVGAQGAWNGPAEYTVVATAKVPTTLARVLPSGYGTIDVKASATAQIKTTTTVTSAAPSLAQLDPEAADYNRIYVYCYDKSRKSQPDKGRSQMTAMADNAGTSYSFTMPVCKEGETISYRLYNVRWARTNPAVWDAGSAERYNWHTDTTSSGGVQSYNFESNVKILETVLCDTLAQCKPQSKGGIIPEGKERNPANATGQCSEGKFMYYGWEDRPPGMGWTDKDYDDIRVIVECPKVTTTATHVLRLVK